MKKEVGGVHLAWDSISANFFIFHNFPCQRFIRIRRDQSPGAPEFSISRSKIAAIHFAIRVDANKRKRWEKIWGRTIAGKWGDADWMRSTYVNHRYTNIRFICTVAFVNCSRTRHFINKLLTRLEKSFIHFLSLI